MSVSSNHSEVNIEAALKDLLEKVHSLSLSHSKKILLYMEKFIETKEDLQLVESELKDYENLACLVSIIKTIFQTLANKIDVKLS
jgi:flavorubredoxin